MATNQTERVDVEFRGEETTCVLAWSHKKSPVISKGSSFQGEKSAELA
jgi:hypothetical protein